MTEALEEFFLVARIHSVYKDSPFLFLELFTDFPEKLAEREYLFADFFGEKKKLFIESVKPAKAGFLIKLKNFDYPEDCEILIGKELYIPQREVTTLPEYTWYIHDLIGSVVLRNNETVGKISDVMQLPANDVLVIQAEDGSEILLPFLRSLVESFDVSKKIMILTPGESLFADEN